MKPLWRIALLTLMWAPAGLAQQAGGAGGGLLGMLLPLIVIFAIFYFLLILPQSRQEKKRKAMLAALKRGDRVVTTGGLLGIVDKVEDQVVTLRLLPSEVKVKVEKGAIRGVLNPQKGTEKKNGGKKG